MKTLTFELITPDGVKFQDSVYEIILPTTMGQITVLPNHEPLIALAIPGVITLKRKPNAPPTEDSILPRAEGSSKSMVRRCDF